MNMPTDRQRLIYKGRQLKDDKLLSDYSKVILMLVNTDDEIIHLMVRTVEPETGGNTGTTGNTQGTGQQPRVDFNNLFGNMFANPGQFVQISNVSIDELGRGTGGTGGTNQPNPFANILQNLMMPRGGTSTTQTTGTGNTSTGTTNMTTSNTTGNNTTTGTTGTGNNTTTGTTGTGNTTMGSQFDAYPMFIQPTQQISQLSAIVNELTVGNNNNMPNIPNHSYHRNILTALGATLRTYYYNMSVFLPLIYTLAEGLERESLMTNSDDRRKLQELARQISRGMNEIVSSTNTLSPLLSGLTTGNAPGQGFATFQATVSQVAVIPGIINTDGTTGTTGTTGSTGNAGTNNDPLNQMLNQLNQPGGLQNMMSMMGSMLGGLGGNTANTTTGGTGNSNNQAGNMMNMFSNLLGGIGGGGNTGTTGNNNFNNQLNNILSTLLNEEAGSEENQMEVDETEEDRILNAVIIII
jgi:hypothetical protein